MCDLIEVECVKAECDLLAACRQSLAHGALLATRYILAEIDFNAGCKEGRAGQTGSWVLRSHPPFSGLGPKMTSLSRAQ